VFDTSIDTHTLTTEHCVTDLDIREFINKYWYTYTDHGTLCQDIKCTWIHQQVLIHIHLPSNTVSRI
jgi:hypothetical protein